MDSTVTALEHLLQRYVQAVAAKTGTLPRQAFDPAWLSPCQVGEPDRHGDIFWRPCRRSEPADFSGLEQALETPLHDSIKQYYGSFWADGFDARFGDEPVSLIQIWNEDDFQRLLGNIIGHVEQQRRAKLPLTVFFACSEADSELFLSVDNRSGAVLLEQAGKAAIRGVADDLVGFLNGLTIFIK